MRHHPMIWLLATALVPGVFACANDTQPQQAAQNGTIIPVDSSGAGSGAGAAGDRASNMMGSGGDTAQTGTPEPPMMMPPSSAGVGGSTAGPGNDPPAEPGPDASTPDEPDAAFEEEPDAAFEEEEEDDEEQD
jgi:hypothetical protein